MKLLLTLAATALLSVDDPLARLEGAWKDRESETVLSFEGDRCILSNGGRHTVFLLSVEDGEVVRRLAYSGKLVPGTLTVEDGAVVLTYPEREEPMHYDKLDEVPVDATLVPIVLGTREPDADEVAALKKELAERHERDQSGRRRLIELQTDAREAGFLETPEDHAAFNEVEEVKELTSEMVATDRENTARLVELLQDVGWISAERFGRTANQTAFLIVQHSGNLRLMQTVLPILEEEAKKDRSIAQSFALLYDRTQLALGGKQRYGTQIFDGPDGKMQCGRVEDRARLDALRAEMGMGPIADYLALFRAQHGEIPIVE